jgi:TetR/AcrR family transcriptional repressor of nem operon
MQSEMKRAHGKVLGCPLCSVGTEVSTHEDAVSAKVRDIFRRKRRYLESAIREAAADGAIEPCDAVQKAQMLTALVEGSVAQARIMNDAEPLRRLPAMGLEVLRVRPAQPARVAAH